MGLFDVFTDVITMPVRVAVDVVKSPFDIMDGETPLRNTIRGIRKIEQDLED